MEVLVLDGILGGYPRLIENITTHLPDLLVLTLFLRGGSNQSAIIACSLNRHGCTHLALLSSQGSDTLNGTTNTVVTKL